MDEKPPMFSVNLHAQIPGEDWPKVYGMFSEIATKMGPHYPVVNVSSYKVDESERPSEGDEYFDEGTYMKARGALSAAIQQNEGRPVSDIIDGILSEFLNTGILLRERRPAGS